MIVATVLTACGIETPSLLHYRWSNLRCNSTYRLRYWNLHTEPKLKRSHRILVATVPTACGIETRSYFRSLSTFFSSCNSTYRLRYWNVTTDCIALISPLWLQQHLPFTVLKQYHALAYNLFFVSCCNSTYRLRYWNLKRARYTSAQIRLLQQYLPFTVLKLCFIGFIMEDTTHDCCNSTYRLRYWNSRSLGWYIFIFMYVATVLTIYGIWRKIQ